MKRRSAIKEKILEYYKDAPIKRWAAYYAGISEDTLANWEKEDSEFSAHLKLLKAEYLRRKLNNVKSSEWVLERMFNEEFIDKTEVALTHKSNVDYIEFVEWEPTQKKDGRR